MRSTLSTHLALLRLRQDNIESDSLESNSMLLALMFIQDNWGEAASSPGQPNLVKELRASALLISGVGVVRP